MTDTVLELICNVDDMTAEQTGFAIGQLMDAGALDVYAVPAVMKKSRPGTILHILCREADREEMLEQIFRHTTTLGVREMLMQRYVLRREICSVQTRYGEVRYKLSQGYGVVRRKFEYDDLARIARKHGISLEEVRREAEAAAGSATN